MDIGKRLFDIVSLSDPCLIVKEYWNIIYSDDYFISAFESHVHKSYFMTEGAWCDFYDDNDEPYPNNAVWYSYGFSEPPDEIYVLESTCFELMMEALDLYVLAHPEDKNQLDSLLEEAPKYWFLETNKRKIII